MLRKPMKIPTVSSLRGIELTATVCHSMGRGLLCSRGGINPANKLLALIKHLSAAELNTLTCCWV